MTFVSQGFTRDEIRELVHEYHLQPYGTKKTWLANQSMTEWTFRRWRRLVFEGDLDRDLIPRGHGAVRIVQQPDGARLLTLENLDTSNGPDVHVWLSAAHVVEGTAGWFTAGSPADVDLSEYPSVDLWCVQFSVLFGAAGLVS